MQDNRSRTAVQAPETAAEQHAGPRGNDTGQAAGPEVMPGLEQLLRQAELAAQEHHDAWLRAKAEADNIRKRAQMEVANAHKYALEGFAQELLPVRDSLEAALGSGTASLEALKSGVELTLKQLDGALSNANIREINPLGEKLDPHKHHAMNVVEADAEPNTVVAVLQKGYELHDRVIRPALVSVSKTRDA
ncbi:MAG TPA: nucleotide exchange factor GrpE [Burkholderiales bacterium]|nr:nucleotide exchange factor GrpE [Burkholderiales bacterium]